MNKINFEKLFSRDANPHATLITRPDVHPRTFSGKYDGSSPRPVIPEPFPPIAGGVLERHPDTI